MRTQTRGHAWRVRVAAGLALAAGAGVIHPALADPDDRKERDVQPPVLGKTWRHPDPWKIPATLSIQPGGVDTYDLRNIVIKSQIPLNEFPLFPGGTVTAADVWGYTSPSGREYALIGLRWGMSVVEVTDPINPVILTTIPAPSTLWKDVDVIGEFAYVVSDSSGVGIQVVDLRLVDSGQVTLVRNFQQGGHTTTHTLIANPASGFLYACGLNLFNGGMVAIDTRPDPTFPTFVGTPYSAEYVHEAHITTYTSGPYAGREIAFMFTGGPANGSSVGLVIMDVTDKATPVILSQISYPGMRFSHQGWLSEDKKYLYMNDELDTPTSGNVPRYLGRIFDVSDLTRPRLVSTWTNGLPSQDHNQYVRGRYMYQSNYTTGLRIFDIIDPLRPFEIAYIDTRPEDDGTNFNGNWGNYPFFASGTILVSDMQRGLFSVALSLLEMDNAPSLPMPTSLNPGQPTPVAVSVKPIGATLSAVTLKVAGAGGPTVIPMTSSTGNEFTAALPASACAATTRYWFEATTSDNRTFRWPQRETEFFEAVARTSDATLFADSFNTNLGWTVQNTSVASGAWVRAQPVVTTNPGTPIGDADGSGWAFVTGNSTTGNLSGGPTRLLSPVLDLSAAPEARVSVSRWLLSTQSTTDALVTEISGDNGVTWATVDSVNPVTGGWRTLTFRVADFVTPSAAVRVRFSVSDNPNNSVTQAGIDNFRVFVPVCAGACYANCDESSGTPALTPADFVCFLNKYRAGDAYANCDGSTGIPLLSPADFVCFLNKYRAGCP